MQRVEKTHAKEADALAVNIDAMGSGLAVNGAAWSSRSVYSAEGSSRMSR